MKHTIARLLCAALLGASVSVHAQSSPTNDREAIQTVMQSLLRAFEKDDVELLKRITRADGMMIWHARKTNQVQSQKFQDWYKNWDGKPAPDEAQRKRNFEILDMTEETALVKLTLDYPNAVGTDYLMLLKVEGEWNIVTKNSKWKQKPTPAK